jgi:peroxiredoxin Q/BCP
MAKSIGVGDTAPDFTLPSQDGTDVSLASLVARGPLVLFFYPKDETAGCTAEVCSFRDAHEAFVEAGAVVAGISSDAVDSHQRFASHHRLPYVLLSDQGGRVREAFGVGKTLGLIPGRVTYVIDRERVVRHVYSAQIAATSHVVEALAIVKKLRDGKSK